MAKYTEDIRISKLNKEKLTEKFTMELPGILEELELSVDKLSTISGISLDKLLEVCNGSRAIMWNEFMSVLFILWRNDRGRTLIEKKNLFPEELKEVLSINKNEHG
ncbi:MAG: hypothetical protein J6P79_00480 [Pseudobutyrivibrio sp.]|nr:hypothetical protein [Pseudobutyrivibrio sp.]